MLDVHRKGKGSVGTYTYDIAATKVTQVRKMAKEREFPLQVYDGKSVRSIRGEI